MVDVLDSLYDPIPVKVDDPSKSPQNSVNHANNFEPQDNLHRKKMSMLSKRRDQYQKLLRNKYTQEKFANMEVKQNENNLLNAKDDYAKPSLSPNRVLRPCYTRRMHDSDQNLLARTLTCFDGSKKFFMDEKSDPPPKDEVPNTIKKENEKETSSNSEQSEAEVKTESSEKTIKSAIEESKEEVKSEEQASEGEKQDSEHAESVEEKKTPMPDIPKAVEPPVEASVAFMNILSSSIDRPNALKEILLRPIPKALNGLRCYIKRNNIGFSKKIYPSYEMRLESNDKFLMVAEKKQIIRSAFYIITTDLMEISKHSEGYLGKLRSDIAELEFNLFGRGENPDTRLPPERIRNQHASVTYQRIYGSIKKIIDVNVIIPEVLNDNNYYTWKPMSQKDHMAECFKRDEKESLMVLTKKFANADPGSKLTFRNEKIKSSVKNLQISLPKDDKTVFEFGRVSENTFSMDASYPLSLYQAFGICLSIFSFNFQ